MRRIRSDMTKAYIDFGQRKLIMYGREKSVNERIREILIAYT